MSLPRRLLRRLYCRLRGHRTVRLYHSAHCLRCKTAWHIPPTTAPGGVDGPPYIRPRAAGFSEVDPEWGARQGDDDSLGTPPGRYTPL